jgi:hypothetical protein
MEAYLVGMVLLILQVLQPKLALFYLLGLFLAVLFDSFQGLGVSEGIMQVLNGVSLPVCVRDTEQVRSHLVAAKISSNFFFSTEVSDSGQLDSSWWQKITFSRMGRDTPTSSGISRSRSAQRKL